MLWCSRYQINARTELAIRYNDQSPLENHHAAVCFQILSQPECNIFANVAEDQFTKIRVGIIALILATDMARHAEILDKFKQNVDHFDWTNEDHITSVKTTILSLCFSGIENRYHVDRDKFALLAHDLISGLSCHPDTEVTALLIYATKAQF